MKEEQEVIGVIRELNVSTLKKILRNSYYCWFYYYYGLYHDAEVDNL